MKKNLRNFSTLCMGLLLLAAAPLLPAQDPVWELSVSAPAEVYYNPDAPTAAGFDASVSLWEAQTSGGGTGAPSDVQGYSFGVAHDPALLSATGAQVTTTSPAGAEPDFIDIGLYSDGFSAGVVFSFVGNWFVNYDTPTELATASYSLVEGPLSGASAPTQATIQKSDTLGQPPVVSVVVVNGASIPLPDVPANLSLIPFTPEFQLSADAPSTVYYPEANPASETFSATINLQEVLLPGGGTGEYSAVQGGSFGIGHDSTLMEATALTVLVTSDAGVAPDFAEVGLETNGATLGLVFSFTGLWTLTFETPTALAQVDYQLLADALAGNTAPTLTTLSFGASVGDPPVENVVVVGGASVAAVEQDASLELVPFTGSRFIRGDATQDANLDLADGIGVLSYLFLGEPTTCLKAMDMDQSNHVSISDGVQVLCSLFCEGSPAPSGPYPDCGVDLDSTLTCESFNACP